MSNTYFNCSRSAEESNRKHGTIRTNMKILQLARIKSELNFMYLLNFMVLKGNRHRGTEDNIRIVCLCKVE